MTSEDGDNQAAVDVLLEVLTLEALGAGGSGGGPADGPQRIYGGQVASQALVAAGKTVDPTRSVHSLHAYFVRAGEPAEPLIFEEWRTSATDGRSRSGGRSRTSTTSRSS